MKKILMILTGKAKFIDIWHYFVGNYRYKLYYFPTRHWLMRDHIRDQISWRINWMDEECYQAGSCKICGCQTTHLQMAAKSCDKPCYPPMMSEKKWVQFWNDGFYNTPTGRFLLVHLPKTGKTVVRWKPFKI